MTDRKIRRAPINITEVVQCVQATGSHFFDKNTMRAFQSRLYDVFPTKFGSFFITSEKDSPFTYSDGTHTRGAWDGQRRYTVRFVASRKVWHKYRQWISVNKRGDLVDVTADDFGAFGKLDAARKFAKTEQARLGSLLIKDKPILFDSTPKAADENAT